MIRIRFHHLRFLFLFVVIFGMVFPTSVEAQFLDFFNFQSAPCGFDEDGDPIQEEINLNCQRIQILDPQSPEAQSCDLYICPGEEIDAAETINVTFFNVNLKLDSEQAVGQVLFIIFSVFLGIVVLAMVLYGVYGSYLRAQADSPDDIATSQKVITNAIIGFLIVGLSLVIIQIFASFIGLGSINELVDFGGALPE